MKLALFLTGDGNYHMAGWRLPGSTNDGGQNIARWVEAAQAIERAKLHMRFIADAASPPGTDDLERLSLTARIDRMDPIPILSAVSMVTQNLGLAATMSTTYLEPCNLARTVASLDHMSGGRAAWNIVTGSNKDDALHFSREGLTLRQMAMRSAAAKHHWTLVGSVKQVADELESWFVNHGADGFNILPSDTPGGINLLVDTLVPELQRRGLPQRI